MKRNSALLTAFVIMLNLCACIATQPEGLTGTASQNPTWQEQYDLGVRYLSEGNYEEAILAFSAAIEIDPKRADAYTSLADIYMELGEYDKAADILEQGLSNLEGEAAEELEDLLAQAERMASIDFDHLVQDAYRETIQDGYDTYMEHSEWAVPKIMLDGPEIDDLNDEIWDTLFQNGIQDALDATEEGYSVGYGCSYQWAVNGDILSIWIESHPVPWAWVDFYVYNISIRSGKQLRDRDVYSAAGLSSSKYRQLVRDAAGSQFWENSSDNGQPYVPDDMLDFFYAQLQNTISEENIQQAKPFFNEKGHLCVAIPIYSLAGADYYCHIIDIEDFTLVPNYDQGAGGSKALSRGITEEEAYEIVRDYWNFVPGTVAEETGYELFLNSFGSMTGSDGRTYYEIRCQWLVDGDTEWGHLSTIDMMYVDAETGEMVGDILP